MNRGSLAPLVPTCAVAIAAACLLAGCSPRDPYEDHPLVPKGYSGSLQFWEERATGCVFVGNVKKSEAPRPLTGPDGRWVGCRLTAQTPTDEKTGGEG